jgi:glycosyltransferase involved in cell wall biosynthesis
MEKINILHIIPNLKSGGAERLTIDICYELAKSSSINVKLVLLSDEIDYIVPNEIDIQILKNKCNLSIFKKNKFNHNEFESILKEFKPDIIHTHLFEAEIIGRYIINEKSKYITHVHDNIKQYKKRYNLLKKKNITTLFEKKWIFNRYKKINNNFITISKDSEAHCYKFLPKKLKKNIILLPNAINFEKFNFLRTSNQKNEKLNIISVGSLVHKKNHVFLLEIATELINNNINFQINIFGDGPLKEFINNQIKQKGLSNHVFLKGKSSSIENEFKQNNYYIHPAKSEPFGLVLLEAMASGLPVLSLDGKGNRDIIKNEINGYIFKEENAKKFADTIIYLEKNNSNKTELIENGYITAKKYDIKNYTDKLISFYKDLLSK